jgi:hypothetical protein
VLDPKFSQDSLRVEISTDSRESRYEISLRETCESHYKIYLQDSRAESCYEISFCKTRKKRFSLRNFVARLASRKSHYKISVCETHKKRVSQLILTCESHKNLARILGLESESRFSREFQKVILVSTLVVSSSVSQRWS